MDSLTNFKAVYCSGIFIPEPSAVSALSLLFEKVYLPRNLKFIKEFAKKYQFAGRSKTVEEYLAEELFRELFERYDITPKISFKIGEESEQDIFSGLTQTQIETAKIYIMKWVSFALAYRSLFPEVFETLLVKGDISSDWKKKDESQGEQAQTTFSFSFNTEFSEEEEDSFPNLISKGYIPVIGSYQESSHGLDVDEFSARQMAALLAMKSVDVIFPRTQGVHPEIILGQQHT